MTSIPAYSIPSLVSALFLFFLGIVTVVSTGRTRLWHIFAAFCFVVGLSSFFGFLTEVAGDVGKISVYARLGLFFALISLGFANFYSMDMTGVRFGAAAKHRRIIAIFIGAVVVIWIGVLAMLFSTDWVVSGVEPLENHGVKLTYGPVMWVALGLFFVGTTRNFAFLLLAYRRAHNPVFREFVGLNLLAFHSIFAPAMWLLFILPVFGLGTQVFAYLAFPVSVMLFNVAIVRYQFGRHRELQESLEQKVEERTEELRRTQVRLAQSERMASLGQLVAGVAHEMNNPVGAVRSIAGSLTSAVARLKEQMSNGMADVQQVDRLFEVVEDAGKVVDEGTRKITRVVDDLKSFARLDGAALQRADLNKELEDAVALLEPVLKPRVMVRKDLGEIPAVLCYPAELNQVMLNLLVNANEAIRDEGVIVVGTRAKKGGVRITVRDTGKGIPRENLEKVLEPGFTTKGRGVGTGLGLAICYQIVRDHDGEIRVESEEGSGTTVTVELPLNGPGPRD